MSGQIDGEHAVVARQFRKDRHPHEGVAEGAVDQQQWWTGPELQNLGLSLRPAHPADQRVGRVPREQRGLCGLYPSIHLGVRVHARTPVG